MPAIISPTADFSASALGRLVQLTTNRNGLVAEMLFGRNLATSAANSAGAKAAAVVAINGGSAPVYGDHQVTLGNGTGLDLKIVSTAAETRLIVCQAADSDAVAMPGGSIYSGASSSADGGRLTLVSQVASGVVYNPGVSIGSASQANIKGAGTPARPLTDFRAMCARVGGQASGSALAYDEFKGGVRVQGYAGVTTVDRGTLTQTVTVGNSTSIPYAADSSYGMKIKHVACLVWNRYLTDAELLAVYLELRAFLAPWIQI